MREYPVSHDVEGTGPAIPASGPRIAGLLLLLAGWILGLLAIVLLRSLGQRMTFVLTGLAVEFLGIALLARSHMPARRQD